MCGIRLESLASPYAEAAHIRPLGAPHNGPDTSDNILCLCPNHHVLFDHGSVEIGEDLSLIGVEERLYVHPQHQRRTSALSPRALSRLTLDLRFHSKDWLVLSRTMYSRSAAPLPYRPDSLGTYAGGCRSCLLQPAAPSPG